MQYVQLDRIPRPVSRLVFGCAFPAMIAGEDQSPLLDRAFAAGITAFDTAENYGKSECVLGAWMDARKNRDQVTVITKGCHPYGHPRVDRENMRHDFYQSLERLRTDYVDVYMLHRDDPSVPVGPIVDVLNRLYDEGKIGAFGGSNWTVERTEEANDYALKHGLQPFTVASPNFGLADQLGDPWGGGCVTISGPENKPDREWYARNHIPVFAYSTMARGFFSGRLESAHPEKAGEVLDEAGMKGYCYPQNFERLRRCEILAREKGMSVAQIAMAWIFNQKDLDVYALTSPVTREMMRTNIAASEIKLTEDECKWLDLEIER